MRTLKKTLRPRNEFHYSQFNLILFETPLFYATPALWPGAHRNNVTNVGNCHTILGHFFVLKEFIFSISSIYSMCKCEIYFNKFL